MEKNSIQVRAVQQADIPALERVIATTDLFPPELLAGMLSDYLAPPSEQDENGEPRPIWLALVDVNQSSDPIGVAYVKYETITDRVWNLLLIAVHKTAQGRGLGTQLMAEVERMLASEHNARLLIVETAGSDEYAATRRFYDRRGYATVATIPDFYADREDKVVFLKRLTHATT